MSVWCVCVCVCVCVNIQLRNNAYINEVKLPVIMSYHCISTMYLYFLFQPTYSMVGRPAPFGAKRVLISNYIIF